MQRLRQLVLSEQVNSSHQPFLTLWVKISTPDVRHIFSRTLWRSLCSAVINGQYLNEASGVKSKPSLCKPLPVRCNNTTEWLLHPGQGKTLQRCGVDDVKRWRCEVRRAWTSVHRSEALKETWVRLHDGHDLSAFIRPLPPQKTSPTSQFLCLSFLVWHWNSDSDFGISLLLTPRQHTDICIDLNARLGRWREERTSHQRISTFTIQNALMQGHTRLYPPS